MTSNRALSHVRILFVFGFITAVLACSTPYQATPISNNMPNIVFVLVDDMGFGDVGYNGSEIATPNLDAMARAGVVLDRNYVYPICSPTRTALMTGQNPLKWGVDGPMSDASGVPLSQRFMPEYFKELGYQTYIVGKWHLGIGNTDYWPTSRGFDYQYGHLGGWIDFYTHVYNEGLDWQRNGQSVREEGHATDLLTADARRVIEDREKGKPFFLYLAYNAPHSPLQITPSDSGLNSSITTKNRKIYAGMVTQFDAGLGKVLATLEAEGELKNTIIVFSSDNGGALGSGASNGKLRGGKGDMFEGGTRVPGLIWWPGVVEGGRVMTQQIVSHDWLATLLAATGSNSSQVVNSDGENMWAAIKDSIIVDRAITTIGVANARAVFDYPWKLVRQTGGRAPSSGEAFLLFNVEEDPFEEKNLVELEPQKYQELLAVYEAMPNEPSLRDTEPPPERFFRSADGEGWNFDLRLPEVREPWAEAATAGNKGLSQ